MKTKMKGKVSLVLVAGLVVMTVICGWSKLIAEINCGGICRDLSKDDDVGTMDIFYMVNEWGEYAGEIPCVEGYLSFDGSIDIYDLISWESDISKANIDLCDWGLPLVPQGPVDEPSLDSSQTGLSFPTDMLMLGKQGTLLDDKIFSLDSFNLSFCSDVSGRNAKLIQTSSGDICVVSPINGIQNLSTGQWVISSMLITHDGFRINVGITSNDNLRYGVPINDAVVDHDNLYIAPATVKYADNEPCQAVIKLVKQGNDYILETIYVDSSNAYDIEVKQDKLYALYKDKIVAYDVDGNIILTKSMDNPVGLAISDYLWTSVGTTVLAINTETFEVERTVHVGDIDFITSLTSDESTGNVWIVGVNKDKIYGSIMWTDIPFTYPRLAKITDVDVAPSTSMAGVYDLSLPTSITWINNASASDLSGDGIVNYYDFALIKTNDDFKKLLYYWLK